MISAQLHQCRAQNCTIIPSLVTRIETIDNGNIIHLGNGRQITAGKVLIATNAFTNFFDLLPQQIDLRVESITTMLIETTADLPKKIRQMPPINLRVPTTTISHISVLPPLPYPDGRTYMKLVLFGDFDQVFRSLAECQTWFQNEPHFPHLPQLKRLIIKMIPDLPILSWQTKPCIVCYTQSGFPIIDEIVPGRVYGAIGGNAGAAHTSDAIGRLAADKMRGKWSATVDPSHFTLTNATSSSSSAVFGSQRTDTITST